MKSLINIIVFMFILLGPSSSSADLAIEIDLMLEAGLEAVWRAWTTPEGFEGFFAPDCHIEPGVDGLYEISFSPKPSRDIAEPRYANPRARADEAVAFTWNAPE